MPKPLPVVCSAILASLSTSAPAQGAPAERMVLVSGKLMIRYDGQPIDPSSK